ncbi:flagellar basal body-associated FliL family protein [uncultured Ruegeria sp.]|uniref:flagellar basal body-associated FliL family protein n=1 Tax=uncultured Ruegeria sp. TaxID=259304 RepID=UPI002615DF74|nr:flagellar basal body-associated FliL family protein [uncultured Ruegeria sp.]
MGKLIPVVFLVVGLAIGVGARLVLVPAKKEADQGEVQKTSEKDKKEKADPGKDDAPATHEYLKLTKQFVVPVVSEDEISALVVLSLSLEVRPGITEAVYEIEPKLRDRFLQVLFDHANIGGFDGAFTQSDNLAALREALLEVAKMDLGQDVSQVLIMSVSRQDT